MPSKRGTLDEEILELLREDGRMSNVEIGRRLEVSEATVRNRVARLLDTGDMRIVAIQGERTERRLSMLFMVDTRPGGRRALSAWVTEQPGVERVIVTTGEHGFLIQARFASEAEALTFSDALESSRWVERIEPRVVLADLGPVNGGEQQRQHTTQLDQVVKDAAAALRDDFGVDRVALHLFDDGVPAYAGSQGLSTEYLLDSTHAVCQHSDSPVLRAANSGRSVIVDDILAEPWMAHMRDVAEQEGLGSLMAIPIIEGDATVVAILTAYFDSPQRLEDRGNELEGAAIAAIGPAIRDYLAGLRKESDNRSKSAS